MARTAGSWTFLGALGVVALLQPMGCDDEGPTNTPGAQDVRDLLAGVGPQVVVPELQTFEASLLELQTALELSDRTAAAEAWTTAMASWQRLEVQQLGPAAASSNVAGEDRRDEIYSWPSVNACRIDQETVAVDWDAADFFETRLVNVYGLDALEYLLHAGPDNDCPNQVDINASGSWDALGAEGVESNRIGYATRIVDQLLAESQALKDAWSGDFTLDATTYGSDQDALNAVFDALFYLELTTKDRKLAEPMGLGDCITECTNLIESPWSGQSTVWIKENLVGFRNLFQGGDGFGLDDLLISQGHADLAEQIRRDTDEAIAAFTDLEDAVDGLIESDPEALTAAFDSLKEVTDALKGDLATTLALQIPSEAAGDND